EHAGLCCASRVLQTAGGGMRAMTVFRVGARYLGVIAALTFFLFPIFWIVTIALKPPDEWTTVPLTWLPRTVTLENFRQILFGGGAGDVTGQVSSAVPAIVNSLIAAPLGTAIAMFVGTSAAFAISRFGTGGRVLPFQILTLRMFPPIVIL